MSRKITSQWFDKVNRNKPLSEYPRPQMERSDWLCLNGRWEYSIRDVSGESFTADGRIIVPFSVETALSGVEKPLLPGEELAYRRVFKIPDEWKGRRIILNFEAVDYECECFINGKAAGTHRGGYLPFSFDITQLLNKAGHNDNFEGNELLLRVHDPSDSGLQQRGKQVLLPSKIYYTATSGIWQSVWLESVPMSNHITGLKISPDIDKGCVNFKIESAADSDISVKIQHNGRPAAEAAGRSGHDITAVVVSPDLWTPENPSLYNVIIRLYEDEQAVDEVFTYFAFRKIEIKNDKAGRSCIFLNDKPIFLHAPLDQGYWPESGMTPPTDDAMIFDIKKTKELGFNCSRKHIKIEPRRWYYHADRLGLMVMQDMVSGGLNSVSEFGIRMLIGFDGRHRPDFGNRAYKRAGRLDLNKRLEFESELRQMMAHLRNHPSIIMWIPFNEAWGQFDSKRIAELVRQDDPSRLIDPVSGWHDQGCGDFRSRHTYSIKLKTPPAKDDRIYFISEYGGYNLLVEGHLWDESRKFGYKTENSREALTASYTSLIQRQLIPLIRKGLGAAVYTQLTDVEIESNGFFTYDRKSLKIDADIVKSLNAEIYKEFEAAVKT